MIFTFELLAGLMHSSGDSDGMVKILADKDTDKILGMHIIGSNAGE